MGLVDIVIDGFFGDTGKGAVVDRLTTLNDYAAVVAPNGGPNSGRTVVINGRKFAMRQVPSGVFKSGVACFIGQGAVFDPELFAAEIKELRTAGIDTSQVKVSYNAPVIMPWDRLFDQAIEKARTNAALAEGNGEGAVGTTGKGIGPAYAHERYRLGFRVIDLIKKESARHLLYERYQVLERLFEGFEHLGIRLPRLYTLAEWLDEYSVLTRDFASNTEQRTRQAIAEGKQVLIETRNGIGIGIKTGTYPMVTSSDMSIGGALSGSGVPANAVRDVILVVKAYSTRVGNGPFPTELKNQTGDFIRRQGGEFGTVTGRPRRCGWLDLPFPRYAKELNGATRIALTKLDVLTNVDTLQVCTSYQCKVGENKNQVTAWDPSNPLETCEPVYETMPGWKQDISSTIDFGKLPAEAQSYVRFIQQKLGVPITMIGTGQGREAVIQCPTGV